MKVKRTFNASESNIVSKIKKKEILIKILFFTFKRQWYKIINPYFLTEKSEANLVFKVALYFTF